MKKLSFVFAFIAVLFMSSGAFAVDPSHHAKHDAAVAQHKAAEANHKQIAGKHKHHRRHHHHRHHHKAHSQQKH